MHVDINWSQKVAERFSKLAICVGLISGVQVKKENEQTLRLKQEASASVKAGYSADTLKENSTVRAYRDFYWELGIDPTKTRPSGEALLRRVLVGKGLPSISTVVDAYNAASLVTIIPISGFDFELLSFPLQIRFAGEDEEFLGIGMEKPVKLAKSIMVMADAKMAICIYPYRDCEQTKISEITRTAMMIAYGAPGIVHEQLKEAIETALTNVKRTSGGAILDMRIFEADIPS